MDAGNFSDLERPNPNPHELWDDAHSRLFEVTGSDEYDAVLEVSLGTDPDVIATWRQEHSDTLTPESVYFLTISEAIKRADRPS